jgi:hypothetical protein
MPFNLHQKEHEIASEIERLRAKLEVIRELIAEQGGKTPSHSGNSNGSTGGQAKRLLSKPDITLRDVIEEALSSISGEFTRRDILDLVESNHPNFPFNPKSSEKHFQKLLEEKKITCVRKGYGRDPAIFRKT